MGAQEVPLLVLIKMPPEAVHAYKVVSIFGCGTILTTLPMPFICYPPLMAALTEPL